MTLGTYISKGWVIHLGNISTAFLNGIIEGALYVEWTGGVYRLLKSLYGLRKSPRLWYQRLCSALLEFGFRKLDFSDCAFVKGNGSLKVVVMVYVGT